jgi:hypothetical protein
MATYKVLQDIEAEDKILGPLTLRQFIYGAIAAICMYLAYFVTSKGFAFMLAVFVPVALVFAFFAFPWRTDQPTEIWALAKIRFLLKPRRRIWDQSIIKELVTITAPKKIQTDYTKGLSETEVTSRLKALAETLDSRGWAIKNANVNVALRPGLLPSPQDSDRLIMPSAFSQAPPADLADIRASDDILDERNNPTAQHLNSMVEASSKAHRQKIMDSLRTDAIEPAQPKQPANNYWFLNQPAQAASVPSDMVTFNTQVVTPGMEESELPVGAPATPTMDEENLVHSLDAKQQDPAMASYYGHLHTIQPLSAAKPPAPAMPQMPASPPVTPASTPVQTAPPPAVPAPEPQVTPAQQAAILQLANNDDLNVATLAREAKRSGPQDDEVVIKLH